MKPKSFLAKSIATLIATTVTLTSALHALPQGAQVQSGTATFSHSGGALNIQTSDRAIINYQSFSIGGAERVNFIQPSTLSLTLNRVTAPNPSQIFGTLTSNGKIVIANPYGIFFGSGAVVNVGGIIAGAGHLSDSDFLAGKINFTNLSGDVENRGRITAVTDVGLYGAHVSNEGVITSQKGSVTLAAGSSVFVGEAGGNIFVGTAPAAIPRARVVVRPGVSNTGRIAAPKASLVAGDMYGLAIAQSGTIVSGDITISAGKGGTAEVSGHLDASNRAPGQTGGSVKITGENVALRGAKIDASGTAGGGTILVGGDYQGGGTTPRSKTASVDATSKLTADAITAGNGGKVIVWADDATLFSGTITARGGVQGGDGGLVETSGKIQLGVGATAVVDASATLGKGGLWLLDPRDVSIATGGNPAVIGVNNPLNDPLPAPGVYFIDPTSIQTALQIGLSGTNVTITTNATGAAGSNTGNINVIDPISWNKASTLTLQADGSIFLNNSINASAGNGSLTLNANTLAAGAVINAAAGSINLGTGTLTVASGTGGISLGAAAVTAGTVNFTSTGTVTINNAANAFAGVASVASTAGGNVTLQTASALVIGAGGINAGANAVSLTTSGGAANAITQNATGVITGVTLSLATANAPATLNTATNAVTNLGAVTLGTGALNLADAGGLTVTGAVAATGGVTLSTSGALVVNNTVNAGAGNVSLTTSGGAANAITQNATGVITGATLSLATANAPATLNTATNAVTNLGVATLGTGALDLLDAGGLAVTGAVAASGGVNLSTSGLMVVNNPINAGAGTVSLATTAAASSISQNASGVITAGTLNLSTSNSGAVLTAAANAVGAVGTVSLGTGSFALNDSAAAGLTLPGATITAGGIDVTNVTGNLTVTGSLTVIGLGIVLNAPSANATISQTAGGAMSATAGVTLTTGTAALAGGSVGTPGTPIAFGAGQTAVAVTTHGGGAFLTDALGSLSVASVDTTGIPNAIGGAVNISTTLAGSALTVGTIITTGGTAPASTDGLPGGALTLSSGGALTMGAITTSGGAATGPGNHNGGVAGTISLAAQAGTTMNVNGSINVAGGAGSGGGGNPGTGQSLTFNNDVVTAASPLLALSGATVTFNARLSPGGDAVATALTVNGSLTFGAGATLFATLKGTAVGTGGATGFDQITVTGSTSLITLSNATLTSSGLASYNVGDALRIINTSGGASLNAPTQFASGAVVTIAGQKFDITYNTAGADHVTLTRAQSLWIWDGGGGDNNWTTDNNWVPNNGNPGSGDVVQFAGATRLAPNYDLLPLTTIDSITFNAGAGAFVISTNVGGLTVGLNNGITNNSASIQTINLPVVLQAAQTFNAASGPIAFGAASSVSGAFPLTLNGGFNIGSGAVRMKTTVSSIVDNMTAGTAFIAQTGALNLSGSFAGANLDLTNAGAITVNAALNAGGGTVSLATTGGAANTITQAATGVITAATLNLATAGADATLNTATNSVANLGTAALGAGALNLLNAGGLTVTSPVGATGGVTLNAGGALAINNTLNAGGGNVSLTTTGAGNAITQNATGVITANTLTLGTANAGATLNTATNAVTNLGGATLGTGSLNLLNAGGLTVTGAVGATGGVILNAGGALAINSTVNAGAAAVSLTTTGAGNAITQNATGVITAGTLVVVTSGGTATLNTVTNVVANLGPVTLGAGSFAFSDNAPAGLAIGPVTANGGIDITNTTGSLSTSAALSSNGGISLRSVTGTLTLGGTVTSNNGAVSLRSNGALTTGGVGAGISATNAASGNVTLISDAGNVTIGAGGVAVGNTLTIQIGPTLTLSVAGMLTAPNVTLVADDMNITAAINSTGTITLAPVTVGTNVTLGNAAPALVGLVIDNTELGFLNSAPTLVIGRNGANPTTAQAIRFGTATVGNATLNLNARAGIDQNAGAVSIGGGAGTLNIAAGSAAAGNVNLLGSGVGVGTLSGGTANGTFDVIASSAAGLTVNPITNTGGEVVIINNAGPITVAGAINSNGQAVAVSTLGGLLTVNAPITASGASVGLQGSGGVTQNGAGIITAANLLAQTAGAAAANVTLTSNNVVSGNITLNAGGGSVSFQDTSAFNVGALASIVFPVAGPLSAAVGSGIRTAAAGSTSLTAGGNVTQSDLLSTGTLNVARLGGANPAVTLNNAGNAVANVGTVALNTGSFTLVNGTNLAIAGAGTAGGGYSVQTAGTLMQLAGGTISTSASNGTIALTTTGGAANAITLNDVLNAGTGAVNLNASGSVTQAGGNILAGAVTANSGAAGSVALNAGTNAFASIAGSGGTGGFAATDSQSLTVAAGGITTGGGTLALTTTGVTSDITVGNSLAATGAANVITLTAGRDILLNSTATATGGTVNLLASRDITETAPGGVRAANLRAVGTTGAVTIAAGAANNNVATIAGTANGNFSYTDANSAALTIGTVTTVGVTSTTGTVSVLANAGTLNVSNAVQGNGSVTLASNGNQTIGATVTSTTAGVTATATNGVLAVNQAVSAAAGTVSLTTTGAGNAITQNGTGVVTAATLTLATANANATLNAATNAVTNFGAVTLGTGALNLLDAGGLTVTGAVGATGGVTLNTSGALAVNNTLNAGGGIVSLTTTGAGNAITQNATGVITAGTLALATANASATLNTATNAVTNLGAVTLGTGTLNLLDAGGLTVTGAVGATGGVTLNTSGVLAVNNVLNAGAGNVSLTTTGGAGSVITQNGTGVITGNVLTLATANADATLANLSNQIGSVGSVALGSGKFTLVDSAGGLTVDGAVTANGGVNITTAGGALSVSAAPGTVTANAGDIILRSTDSGITLAGVLTAAPTGLVQLDAGGAGTISQAVGSSIAANSLIARAPGSITLTQPANDVANLAGASGGGTFSYRDASAVTVNTVADSAAVNVVGITTAGQDITVLGGAGNLAINAAVNAGAGTVRLQNNGGNVTQDALTPTQITAANLLANATGGSVLLPHAGNSVTSKVAGKTTGANSSFRFRNNGAITVDFVAGDANTAAATGITTRNGDVALLANGPITLNQTINAADGLPLAAATSGVVRLQADSGNITQTPAGIIVTNSLLVNANSAASGVVLNAANDAITLAGNSGTGGFAFQDPTGVTFAKVSADGSASLRADLSAATPGLLPPLPIGELTGVTTTGPLILTSLGTINFAVPLILAGSLNVTAAVIDINGGGNPTVQTAGGQTYNGPVVLTADAVLVDLAGGAIRFVGAGSTVNSDTVATPRALTINTSGATQFDGTVGNTAALASVTTDASGTVAVNGGQVATTGAQIYGDDATLGAAATVLSGSAVSFAKTLNGASALTVNASGATVFTGTVGNATALTSLTTDGPGTVAIDGGQVRTTGAQTYGDAATLGANTVLTSTGGGTIIFQNTLNGARTLQVNTTGNEIFNGIIGGTAALTSLTTDALLLGGQTQFNMDVALAPAGRAGVNVTGKVTVNDAVVFNAANSNAAAPTIRTGGGQAFSSIVAGAATFTQDAVLTDTGAQAISFSGTLNGPRGVSVNTAGATTFSGNIGQTTPMASVSTDAAGTTTLPAMVTTTGTQNFADPVTLSAAADTILKSNAAGAINLLSTVNAMNHSLTLSTSGSATLGATISNLTSLTPSVGLTTTIGTPATTTNITVPGPLEFTGPVAVRGDVVIATTTAGASAQSSTSGASLRFDSTVDGPGSLTASSRGHLVFAGNAGFLTTLDSLTATAPIITLNNTRTLNQLKVDALTTLAIGSDGSDGLVNLVGGFYSSLGGSVLFNPTNRPAVSKHATILSNAGNLVISAAGDFFMGNEQKLLVNNGGLTLSAGGIATVGDMAASASMNLTAPAVVFQGRQLNGFFNSNRQDHGLGFVSPTIRFNSASVSFASGTKPVVVFSTRDAIALVRQIAGLSLEIDKDIALQFSKPDLKLGPAPLFLPVVPNVIFGTVQPIASGTRVTEPGQIQVTFVLEIPKVVELPQDTFLSKSDQEILKRMGIYPREATSDENITVSLKRGVFRQPIEGKAEMDDPEYAVVVNRLTTEEVQKIIKAYIAVAGKDPADIDKIATLLDDQVKKFRVEMPGAIGLDGFTKWLQGNRATDKGADELARNLDELSAVFVQLSQVGLTRKEVAICKAKICLALDKAGLGGDEIATLVEGAAKLPPQAPRPAVTAPPPPVDVPPAGGPPAPGAPEPLPPAPEAGAPAPGGPAPTPPPADAAAEPKAQ